MSHQVLNLEPDLHDSACDLDDFDPDLVDYDALNTIIANGSTPMNDLDLVNHFWKEANGSRAIENSDTVDNSVTIDASLMVDGSNSIYASQAEDVSESQADQYDLFNAGFQPIGAYYQPRNVPETNVYANLPSSYLNMEPIFLFPPLLLGDYTIQDRVERSGANGSNASEPLEPSMNSISPENRFTDATDESTPRHLPVQRQTTAGIKRPVARLSQNLIGPPTGDSASSSSRSTSSSKKRSKRPRESKDEKLDAPVPTKKRRKVTKKDQKSTDPPRPTAIPAHLTEKGKRGKNSRRPTPLKAKRHKPSPLSTSAQMPPADQHQPTAPAHQEDDFIDLYPPVDTSQLLFANYKEAHRAARTREIAHDWQPPQNDDTLPTDDVQRGLYVQALVAAFEDFSRMIDNEDQQVFLNRWNKQADALSLVLGQLIEAVCWELVRIAVNLHTHGPHSLGVYDRTKLKDIHKTKDLTFGARIAEVCELLRLSKNRCSTLLKSEGENMTIATPKQLATQTQWNKKQNNIRQKSLVAGRNAEKRKKGKSREPTEEQEEVGSAQDFATPRGSSTPQDLTTPQSFATPRNFMTPEDVAALEVFAAPPNFAVSQNFTAAQNFTTPQSFPSPQAQSFVPPNLGYQDLNQVPGLETFLDSSPPVTFPYGSSCTQKHDYVGVGLGQSLAPQTSFSHGVAGYGQPSRSGVIMDEANQSPGYVTRQPMKRQLPPSGVTDSLNMPAPKRQRHLG